MSYIGSKPADAVLETDDITDGVITTSKLADNSVTTAKTSYQDAPFRNLIINGDMSIAQRSTSTSSITGNGYHTIDRFQTINTSLGTWTQSQSTDVPSGQGFAKSLKMDCTTADASPSSSDLLQLRTAFEGQNLQYLNFGTSSAKSLTLSFWVKSNKTGTYTMVFFHRDATKQFSKSYTISSANTWEKKTITVVGNTANGIDNDNAKSFDIWFNLGAGSNFTSGSLSSSWEAETEANYAVGQVNLADNTANEWYITGVQLEAGTTASDFEFLPHDVNLARCERYFGKSYSQGTNPGTNTWTGTMVARNYDTSDRGENPFLGSFKVNMRTVPTVTIYSKAGNSAKIVSGSTSVNSGSTEYSVTSTQVTRTQITTIQATITATHFGQAHYTADAEL